MKGLSVKRGSDGFLRVALHYTADEEKISPEWRAHARAGMQEWMWQQEYEINWRARGGRLVYDMWDPEIHEVVLGDIPDTWTRYRALDHGLANPTACVWAAVDTENNVWIYREYYHAERVVAENCRAILELQGEKEDGWIRATYADPSIWERHPATGKMLADEYADAGVSLTKANNSITAGINKVSSYLIAAVCRWAKDKGKPHAYLEGWAKEKVDELARKPALYVARRCENTIRELKGLRWKEIMGNPAEHNLQEKPQEVDDHAADAVRYLLMAEPRYRKPAAQVPYQRRAMVGRTGY